MSDRLDNDRPGNGHVYRVRDDPGPSVGEEAAQWFVRLKDERLTRAEQAQYLRWLQASPAHIAEALRMGEVYGVLRRSRLRQLVADNEISNVVDLRSGVRIDRTIGRERGPRIRVRSSPRPVRLQEWRSRKWRRARAAVIACVIVAGLVFAIARVVGSDRTVSTEASEWRRFTLVDGSVVRAGPRTRLQFEFSDARRLVRLSGGEAVFRVAQDPARPFLVSAGVAVVHAVGTQFGVSRNGDRVLITVAEGTVAVTQAVPTHWFDRAAATPQVARPAVALAAGEQAAVSAGGPLTVQRVDVASALAWAQGRLIFEDQNVAAAVLEFNRRNRVQIVIDDPAIAARPVRGVFDAADPESFAQFVAHAAHATIEREPGLLRLHGQPDDVLDDVDSQSHDAGHPLPSLPPDDSFSTSGLRRPTR
jgi:ferric-dicitrate binding protein FerR (iron transport regulator)